MLESPPPLLPLAVRVHAVGDEEVVNFHVHWSIRWVAGSRDVDHEVLRPAFDLLGGWDQSFNGSTTCEREIATDKGVVGVSSCHSDV